MGMRGINHMVSIIRRSAHNSFPLCDIELTQTRNTSTPDANIYRSDEPNFSPSFDSLPPHTRANSRRILVAPTPSAFPPLARPRRSTARAPAYTNTLAPNPTNIPISPVPRAAIGPVHHACCMQSTMRPAETASAASAGHGRGRAGCDGVSHAARTGYAVGE